MKRIFLTLLGVITTTLAFGQDHKAQQLDSLFSALHQKNSFNGNVLIAEGGHVILEKSYGYADENTKRELNLNSIFELASVSKQFTAMGILLLEKQHKLKSDDKLAKYIPELDFYGDITIANLLNHTSGLPDYIELFEEKWDKSKFATNQDIVEMFAKHKPELLFKPNEKFEYSNTGYALLGLIIEKASNTSFEDFLKTNIFDPLQMHNTFVHRSRFKPKKIDNYAFGYVLDESGNKVLTDSFGKSYLSYYLDGIVGDGMVNSTVRDLLIWDRALYTNQLIDDNDRAKLYQTSTTADGKTTAYNYGWSIAQSNKYGNIASHSGGWAGYITFIERHLTNDKTIIFLQNNSLPSTKLPTKVVRQILYNEKIVIEKQVNLNSEDLDKYLGVYANDEFPMSIAITKIDNVLYAQATGQMAIPLDAYENNTFKFDQAGITMVFNPENNSFELSQGGMKITFIKK